VQIGTPALPCFPQFCREVARCERRAIAPSVAAVNSRTTISSTAGIAGLVLATAFLAGCSDPGTSEADQPQQATTSSPTTQDPEPAAGGLADVPLPVAEGAKVDGLVEVAGHRLAVHCAGSGHPTVVVLHGWIDEPGQTSFDYYGGLTADLQGDLRICSYDRANVGDSETVPGTQTPEMVVGDLDGLMAALDDPGPYVLVGQSAGGMVASAYAVAHPDKVAGIVMVDASFDDEVTIEDVGMVPEGAGPCDPGNRRIDGQESLQKIDNCAMYKWAYRRRDRRPDVPLVYLASEREPWSAATDMGAAYSKAIVPLQKAYAASWHPGRFVWVDSGHDIHAEKPAVVGDAVRWVVKEGSR
jgi:pimeloyl-ACP methyl ester carboxylesterase